MKTKTGLFGLGLFFAVGALTMSCGGDDGDGDGNSQAGTSSTSGSSGGGTAGSSSAGTSTSAGTSSSTAGTGGTSSNGGSSGGGTSNGGTGNGGTSNGGTNNNFGGDNGFPGFGGDNGFPGFGGGGFGENCPDTQPTDATPCDQPGGFQNACPYDGTICVCGGQGEDREWNCFGGQGDGGGGPGFP